MIDSMDEELNALWLEVETLTGIRYLRRTPPPNASDQFSEEANMAIENLKDLHKRVCNRKDVSLLSRMQQELNDGEMSPEIYLWSVNRY